MDASISNFPKSNDLLKHVKIVRRDFLRIAMTDANDLQPIVLVNAMGISSLMLGPVAVEFIKRGRQVILWDYGCFDGDGSAFTQVQSYDELVDRTFEVVSSFCRNGASVVSLCNGASLTARMLRKQPALISKWAMVGPYFHLPDLKHDSIYENHVMPLVLRAAKDSGTSANFLLRLFTTARATDSSAKQDLAKAHMHSAPAIMAFSRLLNLYRESDETNVVRSLPDRTRIFYCEDDEAVSNDYVQSIAAIHGLLTIQSFPEGGHYGVYDNPHMITSIADYLTSEPTL